MKKIDLVQGTEKWLDWRRDGVSATDIPVLLGYSPYPDGTPHQLFLQKTGRAKPKNLDDNPAVQHGNFYEDTARRVCEVEVRDVLLPACGECSTYPVLRASFDGLDMGDVPHEFKCPYRRESFERMRDKREDDPGFLMYVWQVKAQCVVADSREGVLFIYDAHSGEFFKHDVSVTDDERDRILDAAAVFWRQVESDSPPDLDPDRDLYEPRSAQESFQWRGNAAAWRNTKRQIDELKSQLKTLEANQKECQKKLVTMMGDHLQAEFDGIKITRYQRRGSVDYSKLCFDNDIPESMIEQYRKASSEQVLMNLSEKTAPLTESAIDPIS